MDIRLTENELRFFRDNGFVIKRNVLDRNLVAKAVDVFWENAPPPMQRDDSETWYGPFRKEHEINDGHSFRRGFRWNFRAIARERYMFNLVPHDPNIVGMASQLLGPDLSPPQRVRGIYATLPSRDKTPRANHLHVDEHPFHLGVVAYLGAVDPMGGGFRVWPTSHRWFYSQYETRHEGNRPEAYEAMRTFFETQPSVECTGEAGDIVFWHHRLAHMAGHNQSNNIRLAVLYDFRRSDIEDMQAQPPRENMWQDWPGCNNLPD